VDFRLTEPGTLHVLEVNPNPDLAPSAGLARMALARGWDFTALVERILVEALTAAPAALSEEHGAFAAAEVPA
jgi:D-alanine-D-alanine ligase